MKWLNYHHLFYFWAVAKEGSLRRAAEKLHISQPTISAQIRHLDEDVSLQLVVCLVSHLFAQKFTLLHATRPRSPLCSVSSRWPDLEP